MADEKKDPRAMLEEAIRRRDELNTFIKVYQQMLGLTPDETATPASNGAKEEPAIDTTARGFDPLSVVYPGMFFGKSQPQAVKALLERVKPRPLKTRLVLEALAKGGAPIGGKKPSVNLWGVLNRNQDTFILVPKAGWGLVDWYEPSVIARMRKETDEKSDEEEDPKKDE